MKLKVILSLLEEKSGFNVSLVEFWNIVYLALNSCYTAKISFQSDWLWHTKVTLADHTWKAIQSVYCPNLQHVQFKRRKMLARTPVFFF